MNPERLRYSFAKQVRGNTEYRHWVLEMLYELQTPSERSGRKTQECNGSGFTAPDAPILSRLAEKLSSDGTLSVADETILKWRLPKYWRQFTEVRLVNPPDREPPSRAITKTAMKAWTEAA